LLYVAVFFLYYISLEALFGRTLGKLIAGTVAVGEDGAKLSFGQAVGRTLCRFIPLDPFSYLGWKSGPRGWHDRIPRTVVVASIHLKECRLAPPILSPSRQPVPQSAKLRRPAVVITATVIYGFVAVLSAITLFTGGFRGLPLLSLAWLSLWIMSFLSLVAVPRSRVAYYVTSTTLGSQFLAGMLFGAFRPQPQHPNFPSFPPLLYYSLRVLVIAALGFFFWRFTFGRPSRSFFGVPKAAVDEPPPNQ
jgi:hypothetical protein